MLINSTNIYTCKQNYYKYTCYAYEVTNNANTQQSRKLDLITIINTLRNRKAYKYWQKYKFIQLYIHKYTL